MRSRIPTISLSHGNAHLPTPGAEQVAGYNNNKKSSIPRFPAVACPVDLEKEHASVMIRIIPGDNSRASAHWIPGEATKMSKMEAQTAPLTPSNMQPPATHFSMAPAAHITTSATAPETNADYFLAPPPPPNASLLPLPPTTTPAPPRPIASVPTPIITPMISFVHNISVTPNTPVTLMQQPADASRMANISPDGNTPSPPTLVMSPLRRRIFDACGLLESHPTSTPEPFGTPASAAAAPISPLTGTSTSVTATAADTTIDSYFTSRSGSSQAMQPPSPPWSLITTPRTLFDTAFTSPSPFAASPGVLSSTPSPTLAAAAARLAARALTPLLALELGFHMPERRQSVAEVEKVERGLTACSDAMGARAAETVRAAEAEEAALDDLGWELWEAQLERLALAASEAVRGGWSDWEEAVPEAEVDAEMEPQAPLSQNNNNGEEDGEDDEYHSHAESAETSSLSIADDDDDDADVEAEGNDGASEGMIMEESEVEEMVSNEKKSVGGGWLAFGSGLLATAVVAATTAVFLTSRRDADAGLLMPVKSNYHPNRHVNPEIAFAVPRHLREMELRKIVRSQILSGVASPAVDEMQHPSGVKPPFIINGTPVREATPKSGGSGGSSSSQTEKVQITTAAAAQMLLNHPQYGRSAIPDWLLADPIVVNEDLDSMLAPENDSMDDFAASDLREERRDIGLEEDMPPCDDDEAADGDESEVTWLKQIPVEGLVTSGAVETMAVTAPTEIAAKTGIFSSLARNLRSLHSDAGSTLRSVGLAVGGVVTSAGAALLWASGTRSRRLRRAAAERLEWGEQPLESVDSYGEGPEPLWAAPDPFGSGEGEEAGWGYGAAGVGNTAGGVWGSLSGGVQGGQAVGRQRPYSNSWSISGRYTSNGGSSGSVGSPRSLRHA